jgi:antirestriction protein ArdC
MTTHEQLTAVVERLISKIEDNETGTWIKPFGNSFPANYVTKSTYSGLNIFNLWGIAEEKNYSTNYWMTYNQIKALGGSVKKDEKASPVFFFKPIEFKETDESTNEERIKKVPMLKIYNVFNVDQTTLEIAELNDNKEILDVQDFINKAGVTIKNSIDGAYYNPSLDYIGIPNKNSFKSSELYYATLLHELSHATGHTERLNRDFSGRMNGTEDEIKSYAKEELIAETTRAFLQVHLNLNTTEMETQNASYLKSWLKPLKEDPKMLWKIFSEASKAYRYLLELTTEAEKVA